MDMVFKVILSETESQMERSIGLTAGAFSKLNAGRANPALLESVWVPAYGGKQSLKSLASIALEGPFQLVVTPYDSALSAMIEKAIRTSGLGVSPVLVGSVLRVSFPPLTEERRKELLKILRSEAEKGAVNLRNIRRSANEKLRLMKKDKLLSEDELSSAELSVQHLLDQMFKKMELVVKQKEKEILNV